MDEDIKILEEYIDTYNGALKLWQIDELNECEDLRQAIENLLKRYKDLKRANSDLQGEQEQLYDKLDKLEEENAMLKKANNITEDVTVEDITQVINKSLEEFKREFIPTSVIQKKHKEVVDRLNYLNCKNGYTTREEHEEIEELCNKLAFLEELLEERSK